MDKPLLSSFLELDSIVRVIPLTTDYSQPILDHLLLREEWMEFLWGLVLGL